MKIIQTPVTGSEYVANLNSPFNALSQFYAAFNSQNCELMRQNWLQNEDTSMSNPLGGIKRGWKEIKQVYQKIFTGPGRVYVEFYDYSIHTTDNMFIAVGRERGLLTIDNTRIQLAIRTSRIFYIENSQWKQLHHHGSIDQSDLLANYQSALTTNKESA